jgi:hypothetical protein
MVFLLFKAKVDYYIKNYGSGAIALEKRGPGQQTGLFL